MPIPTHDEYGQNVDEFGQLAWQAPTIMQISGQTVRVAQFDVRACIAIDEEAAVFESVTPALATAMQVDTMPTEGWWFTHGRSTDSEHVQEIIKQAGFLPEMFDVDHAACYDTGVFVPSK